MAYALDAPDEQGDEPAAAAAARAQPLPLSVAPHQCSVRVSYWEQVGLGLGCDVWGLAGSNCVGADCAA